MGSTVSVLAGTPFILIPQSDNVVSITVARGSDGTTPVTDATGSMTLYDEYGQAVAGATGISMSTTGSAGVYTATIPAASFNPNPGRSYRLKISLTSGSLAATRVWWGEAWVAETDIA